MAATALYLVRHGATAANLARPPRLQGRRGDPPLAPEGVLQAEAARDALRHVELAHAYASPLLRAAQTADLVLGGRGLVAAALPALTECDVGRWEGLSWEEVREREPEELARFLAGPWHCPYPEGESLADVQARAWPALERLLRLHAGQAILVVAHQVVLRACLAPLLGLPPVRAREVRLANGGALVVVRDGERTNVQALGGARLPGGT